MEVVMVFVVVSVLMVLHRPRPHHRMAGRGCNKPRLRMFPYLRDCAALGRMIFETKSSSRPTLSPWGVGAVDPVRGVRRGGSWHVT